MTEVGDVFEDDDGQLWTITDRHVYLEVEIDEEPETEDEWTTQTNQWPADQIEEKIGSDLTPVMGEEEAEEEEETVGYSCAHCGEDFESQQAVAGHQPCPEQETDDE